jgi:hypothetical protein
MKVGLDLESCTSKIEHLVIDPIPYHPKLKDRRIVIVDTPGFDDTFEDDGEILRRISVWLASSLVKCNTLFNTHSNGTAGIAMV